MFFKLVNSFVTVLAALLMGSMMGCVSSKPPARPLDFPYSRIYPAPYDAVWEATLAVLDLYVISGGDRESGVIETEPIQARYNSYLFEYPNEDGRMEEVKYVLKVRLSKGLIAQTAEPATRVQVTKQLSTFKNFFSDWQRAPTDQLEEEVILYRIGQRLRIWETLRRKKVGAGAAAKSEKPSPKTE